ncbi:hypothetical protein [Hyalangium minutum]|uniref:Uncharacterized protein n=1 Tax=Hyalangium minutum TaxID=394096 RepID=A0A085WW78_9BACT|nr:hypothetical protein [Hyalangium minutum]KFE71941.1 hypothetical protein DB31_0202 [Hyalangium minutum]
MSRFTSSSTKGRLAAKVEISARIFDEVIMTMNLYSVLALTAKATNAGQKKAKR